MKNIFSKKFITLLVILGVLVGLLTTSFFLTYPKCSDWQSRQGTEAGFSGPAVLPPAYCAVYGIS